MIGNGSYIETNIPSRLDRLPWSRWHWLIVIALGVTWILDGLEVTIVGTIGPILTYSTTLNFTEAEVGLSASAYLAGTVIGALLFSYLTDLQGRKRWFMITLVIYLTATVLAGFSWDLYSFMFFRFLAGAGIGGEYSAINSAIDELIPARVRGQVDLAINGSWWLGTLAGSALSLILLNVALFPVDLGWRLCFLLGAVLGLAILIVRRYVPESPRWLMTHGRIEEAEKIVMRVEEEVKASGKAGMGDVPLSTIRLKKGSHLSLITLARQLLIFYPSRTVLGLSLMFAQSCLYNATFFSYALILSKYHHVPADRVGLYIMPFALANFLGPLILGRFFDTIGRKVMIGFTYGGAALLLSLTGYLFWQEVLTAATQTLIWSAVFFLASAGASAAYLTVSESFPLEIRASCIALFFVVAQGVAAVTPWIFGGLVERSKFHIFIGYLFCAGLMALAALVTKFFGINAERRSLEEIAPPLSSLSEGTAYTPG